jgi:hypothetical protein
MTAILGTLIAQLFTMQQQDSGFGYSQVGKPMASVCFALSICTVLLGACRVWRQQHAMIAGKALTGGFEIIVLSAAFLAVSESILMPHWNHPILVVFFPRLDFEANVIAGKLSIIFFGFLVAIDVVKESPSE